MPTATYSLLAAAFLLAQHGEQTETAEQYLHEQMLNRCAIEALSQRMRNGGLKMNETGHGSEADRALEACRKALGERREP